MQLKRFICELSICNGKITKAALFRIIGYFVSVEVPETKDAKWQDIIHSH